MEHPRKVIAAAQASSQTHQSRSFLREPLRSRRVASFSSLFSNGVTCERSGRWLDFIGEWLAPTLGKAANADAQTHTVLWQRLFQARV